MGQKRSYLSDSCIIAPTGEVIAHAVTDGDELVVADRPRALPKL